MTPPRFVIVGASLAGAKAAETLRHEGFDGEVVLVGEEPVRPYERPPLSKGYLQGSADRETVFVHDAGFYGANGIDLRLSRRVEAIDPRDRRVVVDNGERIDFDSCLITTGATPRRLNITGSGLDGVYYLRDLADADRLRAAITVAARVVVIGAGWIGCEVAASARQLGAEVALVEAAPVPLGRVLGEELGRFYADLHAERGVELHLGVGVDSFGGAERVEEVRLADGRRIGCDLVVVGVGVAPRLELAEGAGLDIDNGIVTEEYLATSASGIYAAGDVANAWHPVFGRLIRLEHWSSALNQGPVAARNMLGQATAYTKVPYFFSDQYDVGMEYSGYAPDWDCIIYRGDPAGREFIAFWMKDGRVAAGMNVNVWGVADHIASLVAAQVQVDPARLADPDTDLAALAERARPASGG
jgi:3-phenylpropionate/trans-cinnamate dioxygenase ferredoxin reductase component